ncbi:MAG TPA: acyl-CoA dehydrogenase family protein [Burkholderiaceae bacterium]|nr:acyl-CoA dehydrogenase family protein [Burkholderiaceae bacterium]
MGSTQPPNRALQPEPASEAFDWNTLADEEFRAQVREFIRKNFPPHLRDHPRRIPRWHDTRPWYEALHRKGWIAPNWPREHGGMGLDASKLIVYVEEMERHGVPRLYDMGLFMLGPILIRHGSDDQKARYLPKILSGEHRWAQGYSEPNAGSDLASLRTTAQRHDHHYVVNGHKTWTTFLDDATHLFLLARTSRAARKQQGLTLLLLDLHSPGVTRRLIRTLAGHEELGEVFLENVHVPIADVVGTPNHGWGIAKDLLEFERINNGSPKLGLYALEQLERFAKRQGLFDDPAFVDRFTVLRLDLQDQYSAYRHFVSLLRQGCSPGAEVSMLKIWSTTTYQRLSELFLEVTGEAGVERDEPQRAQALTALRLFYRSRPATIYSGSNEIQRNLLARRVLGLPMQTAVSLPGASR